MSDGLRWFLSGCFSAWDLFPGRRSGSGPSKWRGDWSAIGADFARSIVIIRREHPAEDWPRAEREAKQLSLPLQVKRDRTAAAR